MENQKVRISEVTNQEQLLYSLEGTAAVFIRDSTYWLD